MFFIVAIDTETSHTVGIFLDPQRKALPETPSSLLSGSCHLSVPGLPLLSSVIFRPVKPYLHLRWLQSPRGRPFITTTTPSTRTRFFSFSTVQTIKLISTQPLPLTPTATLWTWSSCPPAPAQEPGSLSFHDSLIPHCLCFCLSNAYWTRFPTRTESPVHSSFLFSESVPS